MSIRVVETAVALREELDTARARGAAVGFVPTMGYLHEGHVSLARIAGAETDLVVLSIFVNPLQFAAGEDLASYPRDLPRDLELASSAGVGLAFVPTVEEMYPRPLLTSVAVAELSAHMEGAARPTHFSGVATVVAKLLNLVGPCRAYFGEKDYQQLAVVRRMVADLSYPVDVIGCPIVREPDGLAMSSRNVYLTPTERAEATVLHRALGRGADAIAGGATNADEVRAQMAGEVASTSGELDYAEVVDAATLEPMRVLASGDEVRLLIAARFGRPRLLDNLGVRVP